MLLSILANDLIGGFESGVGFKMDDMLVWG